MPLKCLPSLDVTRKHGRATCFVIALALLPCVFGEPELARQADAFVDSIGVNVHLHYYDTTYADFDGRVFPLLGELGVRHIRDGICPVKDGTKPGRLQTLYTELGVRATLMADPRCETTLEAFTYVNSTLGTGVLSALEGPNEFDLSGEVNWAEEVRAYQEELYTVFKAVPETAAIPIIGPSVTGEEAAAALGNVTDVADMVNMHSYYSFRPPETAGWGSNGYGSLTWQLEAIGQPLGAKTSTNEPPIVVTEAGYHNAYETAEGSGLPEEIAAIYLPRLLLNHFSNGIARTFIYELLDEWDIPDDREANFGLVRFDGSKKPAFMAIKNLISLLEDPGRPFTPAALDFDFQVTSSTVSWTLLQKRSGDFYLALWDNSEIFNPENETSNIQRPEQTVSLVFGEPVTRVHRAKPNEGARWHALSLKGPRLELTISSEATILRISPRDRQQ